MSEIPDDVAASAGAIVSEIANAIWITNGHVGFDTDRAINSVARAILAERERFRRELAEVIAKSIFDKALDDLFKGIDFSQILGENYRHLTNKNPAI